MVPIIDRADARAAPLPSDALVLDSDPRWQLVGRIIVSESFNKSHKLKIFLSYICWQTLLGNADELNEQTIGIEVFGKPAGYDSNEDNLVRAHASRLRQKLNGYFLNEGSQEPLRVSIPKGGYVPSFHAASTVLQIHSGVALDGAPEETTSTPPEEPEQQRALTSPPQKSDRRVPSYYWLLTVIVCLLSVGATWVAMNRFRPASAPAIPEVNHTFWTKLFGGAQQTVVINGDSSLDFYENITGQNLSLSDYISGQYRSEPAAQSLINPDELRKIARRRLTSVVDLDIADRISLRPEAPRGGVVLRYARDVHLEDLKQSNIILIGSQEANPWVELFEDSLNFNIIPDQKTKIFAIFNRDPKPGELHEYQAAPGGGNHRVYALVDLLPNPGGEGYVLILQGTAMAGTEAAADFVLARPKLETLLHLSASPGVPLPKFEILLETSNLSGNAPASKVVAVRVSK